MNELVGSKKVDELVTELIAKKQEYANITCTQNDYLFVEESRKSLTRYIDTIKGNLEQSEQEYLKPYKDFVEPVKNALNDLLEIESNLKSDILNCKKVEFKETVKARFYDYCKTICVDGIIPNFEIVYEPSWFGKTKKVWDELLLKKLMKVVAKLERMTAYFVIHTDTMQLEEIKKFMNEKSISYKLETVKEN